MDRFGALLSGSICLWVLLVGPEAAGAEPLGRDGVLPADQWACLLPLLGNDCTGGGEESMLRNWVAPHDLALESPHLNDDWSDIDFGGSAASGAWLGKQTARWSRLLADETADFVDFDAHLRSSFIRFDNFVLAVAVTYVENLTGTHLEVGLCAASTDAIQVWVNRALVLNRSACRPLDDGCADLPRATLATGINRICVLVWHGHGDFGFRLALRRPDGTPLEDSDPGIQLLGAQGDDLFPAMSPTLERSYAGGDHLCPGLTPEIRIQGEGFPRGYNYTLTERIRGEVTELDIFDHGNGVVTRLCDQAPRRIGDSELLESSIAAVQSRCGFEGVTTLDGEVFTTRGAPGGDIWREGDTFAFAFLYLEGDFDIAVEIAATRFPHTSGLGRFGLMARQSLDPNARFTAIVDREPGLGQTASYLRRTVHLASDWIVEPPWQATPPAAGVLPDHPRFLRLVRHGDVVAAFVADTWPPDPACAPGDDCGWLPVGDDTWEAVPRGLFVGFVYSVNELSGCDVGEVDWRFVRRVTSQPPGCPPGGVSIAWSKSGEQLNAGLSYRVAGLPRSSALLAGSAGEVITDGPKRLYFHEAAAAVGAFAQHRDVGAGGGPSGLELDDRGTPTAEDDRYTIRGSGAGILEDGKTDQLHFAYTKVVGDFVVEARFGPVRHAGDEHRGKYGLMARWHCSPEADCFFVHDAAAWDLECATEGPRTAYRGPQGKGSAVGEPLAVWWEDVFPGAGEEGPCGPLDPDPRAGRLPGTAANASPFLRLVRRGNTLYGYGSDDGETWRILGAHSWAYVPEALLVGVAATSGTPRVPLEVSFDSFRLEEAPLIHTAMDGDEVLEGALVSRSDFSGVRNGLCPPGWMCSQGGTAELQPAVQGGRLRLTATLGPGTPDTRDAAAAAFLAEPISTDGACILDLDVFFSFTPGRLQGFAPGHGLTVCFLALEDGGLELGARRGDAAGGLGYGRINLPASERLARSRDLALGSFAIELDNWHDGEDLAEGDGSNVSGWQPLGGRAGTGTGAYHVGLDVNGSMASAQRNIDLGIPDRRLPDIYDPFGIHLRILYDHGRVRAWIGSNLPTTGLPHLVIDHEIEPLALTSGRALLGFTAGTGDNTCTIEVDNVVLRAAAPSAPFHRGDTDGNGELELTDCVAALDFLFSGKVSLSCLDAADADDNGVLEITDAVRILAFLFLGAPAPPPPAPCGVDPTADGLDCVTFPGC